MKNRKKPSRRESRVKALADNVVYAVCDYAFQKKLGATKIARKLRKTWGLEITREAVYPILAEANRRGYIELVCPLHVKRADTIVSRYELSTLSNIPVEPPVQVVNTRGLPPMGTVVEVARRGAKAAAKLILEIGKRKGGEPVHVAFASGKTARSVAWYLAELIRKQPEAFPKLVIHALSSGFSVDDPLAASITFFSFFEGCPVEKYVGLFSTPFVRASQWEEFKLMPGVYESFAYKKQIDLVITSMAWAEDEHGEFMKFLKLASRVPAAENCQAESSAYWEAKEQHTAWLSQFAAKLRAEGWKGDVQFQLFSAEGPIETGLPFRAVTLFTIAELVELAKQPGKAVLLVSGPCPVCGESRSGALKPLLANPALKVWSHLVIDDRTAEECCWDEPPRDPAAGGRAIDQGSGQGSGYTGASASSSLLTSRASLSQRLSPPF